MSQPRPRKTQQKIVDRESAGSTSAARSEGKRKERDGASTGPGAGTGQLTEMDISSIIAAWRRQPLWMVLAVASGACAAINGVFAKLTTTALTSTLSASIATLLGLSRENTFINVALRGTFFGLNLLFNALMWALFTSALTRAESTTRVSIINVSANFVITAMLGWMIFSEKLSGVWWLGAAMLAAGTVVIGSREEGKKPGGTVGLDETRAEAENLMNGVVEGERSVADLVELDEDVDGRREGRREEQRPI